MFSLILRCLEQHFSKSEDIELLVRYLKSISQLNRFSIVKMFMDNNDKKGNDNTTIQYSCSRRMYKTKKN